MTIPATSTAVSAVYLSKNLRCPCGRAIDANDIVVAGEFGGILRIVCRCHRLLLEVEAAGGSATNAEVEGRP